MFNVDEIYHWRNVRVLEESKSKRFDFKITTVKRKNNDFIKFSDQTAISSRLETRNFEILQQGLGYEPGGRQDRIPEGDLPMANLWVGLLRGQADDGPQLPRATACGHQQARSQPHSSTNEGQTYKK